LSIWEIKQLRIDSYKEGALDAQSGEKKIVINQPYPPENECLLRNIMGKSLTQ